MDNSILYLVLSNSSAPPTNGRFGIAFSLLARLRSYFARTLTLYLENVSSPSRICEVRVVSENISVFALIGNSATHDEVIITIAVSSAPVVASSVSLGQINQALGCCLARAEWFRVQLIPKHRGVRFVQALTGNRRIPQIQTHQWIACIAETMPWPSPVRCCDGYDVCWMCP